ncbi:MAG: 2-dehydropantoate 2-reductase [Synergistaceae bacterium]|jgi:2-dehydropantoate 2-reductase|nr:2-dehydropantoate 2-reductase [Synergistaceae bacterium]
MKKIETVSLIGLGAVGCVHLKTISDTLPMSNIEVIASGERAKRLRANGIALNGDRVSFPVHEPGSGGAPADLLIFAVKQHCLSRAIEDARDQVGPDTIILSFLNGISSEGIISAAYGADKVLYSLLLGIDAVRGADGTSYTTAGRIPFGNAVNEPGSYSENVESVKEFFERVGIRHEIPLDMIRMLWIKFMMNVGVNQTTAVLRCPYGALHGPGYAVDLATSLMEEVVAISSKENVALCLGDIGKSFSIIRGMSAHGKTSMLQDVEAGRQTEVDIFGGAVAEMGKKHGVPVPMNETFVRLIRAIEENSCKP